MTGVPIIELGRVYHVGSLDPDLRGSLHRSSQEGPCLSISLCPDAWTGIARLGGSDLFALERDGGVFLDVHAAMADRSLRETIVRWAAAEGLIAFRERWKAWAFQDDTEEWTYFTLDSRAEAEAEVDEFASGPDGGPAIELVMGYVATGELSRRLGCPRFDDVFALEFAAMAWARDVAPTLTGRAFDGVWFLEDYAPERHSAPRGGIFPEALPGWGAIGLPRDSIDDDEALATMPDTTILPSTAIPKTPSPGT
ncbi:hypothetical protein [Methylobacterium fujisawaense]